MRGVTREEARAWCQRIAVTVTSKDYLCFTGVRHCIAIDLPKAPHQVVALANSLLPYGNTESFGGALLWIRQWGIWNELEERVALRVMELMRRIHGDPRSLADAPALIFDETELVDLHLCVIQPLLVGWDAFLVPNSGDYIVATSHDETTCVLGRTEEIHGRLLSELEKWSPREDSKWYFQNIGVETH